MKLQNICALIAFASLGCSAPVTGDGGASSDADSGQDATGTDMPTADGAVMDGAAMDVQSVGDTGVVMDVPTSEVVSNDVPNRVIDAAVCDGGTMLACGAAGCVDPMSNLMHCGACGMACPVPANGTAACTLGVCGIRCSAGFDLVGGVCVASGPAPRPIAPISLSDVTLQRPTVRWELPPQYTGAQVEFCRDRACTMVIETVRAMGNSTRPTMALPARSVVFWRMRGTDGAMTGPSYSPTWNFHVPAADNSGAIDTSYRPHVDVNGDGFDDLLIGAPGAGVNGTVQVHYGSLGGMAPPQPMQTLTGAMARDRFGAAVAGAGDVNGDGFGDVIVGAPSANPGGMDDYGTVTLFLGSAIGLDPTPARTIEGSRAMSSFGGSIATVGDLNRDGYADIVIGAQADGANPLLLSGSVRVYHGTRTGLGAMPAWVTSGQSANDQLGQAVSSGGDVNGDGYSDLVISAPVATVRGIPGVGIVFVYHGAAGGLPMAPTISLTGDNGDGYGNSLACAGDINNDGFTDLLIGAPLATPRALMLQGFADIFHGSRVGITINAAATLYGAAAGDQLGRAVVGLGDVNGDGFSDIAISAPQATIAGVSRGGAVSIYHGSAMGSPVAASRVLSGRNNSDTLGGVMAAVGDFNGDGYADLIAGSGQAIRGGGIGVGFAALFYGSAMGVPAAMVREYTGGAAGDNFGASLASLQRRFWLNRFYMI